MYTHLQRRGLQGLGESGDEMQNDLDRAIATGDYIAAYQKWGSVTYNGVDIKAAAAKQMNPTATPAANAIASQIAAQNALIAQQAEQTRLAMIAAQQAEQTRLANLATAAATAKAAQDAAALKAAQDAATYAAQQRAAQEAQAAAQQAAQARAQAQAQLDAANAALALTATQAAQARNAQELQAARDAQARALALQQAAAQNFQAVDTQSSLVETEVGSAGVNPNLIAGGGGGSDSGSGVSPLMILGGLALLALIAK